MIWCAYFADHKMKLDTHSGLSREQLGTPEQGAAEADAPITFCQLEQGGGNSAFSF